MSNKHRKLKQPKPKPTVEAFLRQKVQEIKNAFGPEINVTLVLGNPADPETDTVFHDGNPRHAALVLERQMPKLVAPEGQAGGS